MFTERMYRIDYCLNPSRDHRSVRTRSASTHPLSFIVVIDCFSRFVHTPAYKEVAKKIGLPQTFRFNDKLTPTS
ncbi:hypothetical protein DICVIV_07099 [Dictyocaulus viviparus]|uniref:Uncharacterized protein n=1 Tax=Dictyocaulus viviparus TaxID=29172 RepID=A0A0D8XSU7_DICVI|nr:hypothetical protein DICVIV_07099 [Dictyocaulus viviparus]